MDWSEGARSSYIKVGRLKKKFTRLHNALKAQDSSPVNEADHLESVSLFLQEEDEDPAESNPSLKAKLDKQLRENRSKLDKVMNDFVERQETGLVGVEDEGSSIDLESEDECQSLDDEEEDIDEE